MTLRKMITEKRNNDAVIPEEAMKFSGFAPWEPAEYHALNNAVVVLKQEMDEEELRGAVLSLTQLVTELEAFYEAEYGEDDCCEDDPSPCDLLDGITEIHLTERQRQDAGIPEGALLCTNEYYIAEQPDRYGLDISARRVPAALLRVLLEAGICLDVIKYLSMIGDVEHV